MLIHGSLVSNGLTRSLLRKPEIYSLRSKRRGCLSGVVKAASQDGSSSEDNKHLQKIKSLPLSLFTPYKNLPKPGQIVDEEELKCDPMMYNCRTPVYVYEEKCASCSGTGYVRHRPGNSRNGRGRGGLNKCLVCTGLGYVRLTTTRYEPQVPVDPQDDTQFSVGRTLPASEVKQTPKFDPMGPTAE
ncbi:hypothetical protein DUNSADRAFT_14759 [Dunaliella salina]|uniref:Encoded protein n=1 Tax=Dunaliella salina TaxID=3046 RepID=A0ABQ7G6U7_DUNSA|nr:hypothetical protein DUNSADRAFT_14759 [Dunaliella salina]|eukprot:KAF5830305.1 hypothetical protein DUNSADRAFT_14759 [Dunaliella salina]